LSNSSPSDRPAADAVRSLCDVTIKQIEAGHVAVQVQSEACKGCRGGCLKRLFQAPGDETLKLSVNHFTVPVANLTAGQRIQVSFPTRLLLALSAVIYLVPMIVMLLFAIGSRLVVPGSDALLLVGILSGLASGLLCSNLLVRSIEAKARKSLVCDPV
jgi:positive regulator of sigma E activity